METFTPPRLFVPHPDYQRDRDRSLRDLRREIRKKVIDLPLLPLVRECMPIPHCFTVQCCYGHFVHKLEPDEQNLAPLSPYMVTVGPIRYRIAYLALCLEDSPPGHAMYSEFVEMTKRDPAFVQFGSADWFWERTPNTYCIQLEPERMKREDSGPVTWEEALRIEDLRGPFFSQLRKIMHRHRVQSE